jgi:6,7-dimethyl-8-ribityllumazine synthase
MNQTTSQASNTSTTTAVEAPRRIAFVQAMWHADIVQRGREGFMAEVERLGVLPERIDTFTVPGAFEIPLHARQLAASGRYAAVVACAFVVDGGIYRHEFVADAVIQGLMRVMLDSGVPVISCVLTPKEFHEHEQHRRFFTEHFVAKGAEAARACVQTVEGLRKLAVQLAR